MTEKFVEDKTRAQHCTEALHKHQPGKTYNDLLLEFERNYQEFLKNGVKK